jgi:outer membrane protein assembly factor BamA
MRFLRIAAVALATAILLLAPGFTFQTAQVPEEKILRHLELKSSFPDSALLLKQLRIIHVDGPVSTGMIEADIETNLKSFLKERGYMEAEVTWDEFSITGRFVGVRIHVAPGMQYRLSRLEFREVKAFPMNEIADQFPLRPGDIVNFRMIKEGLGKVKEMYAEQGYINWSYIPEQNIDSSAGSMDLAFTFVEDIPCRIGFVVFTGCGEQAEEDRLRELLQLRPGEVFRASDLKASLIALNKLGLYGEIREKDAELLPVEGKPGWVAVTIRLSIGLSIWWYKRKENEVRERVREKSVQAVNCRAGSSS